MKSHQVLAPHDDNEYDYDKKYNYNRDNHQVLAPHNDHDDHHHNDHNRGNNGDKSPGIGASFNMIKI